MYDIVLRAKGRENAMPLKIYSCSKMNSWFVREKLKKALWNSSESMKLYYVRRNETKQ